MSDNHLYGLTPQIIQQEEEKAQTLLSKLTAAREHTMRGSGTVWIHDTRCPTALDAHVIPFLARLNDVGRADMVGDTLKSYLSSFMNSEMSRELFGDENTMYNPHKGH